MGLPRTAVLTGLAVLVTAAPAHGATFTVNTTADTAGPVGCPTVCTIRNAISAAAANNLTDDIVAIPAGTYTLNPQLGALSVPASATRITIDGAGANTTFIQPSNDPPTGGAGDRLERRRDRARGDPAQRRLRHRRAGTSPSRARPT